MAKGQKQAATTVGTALRNAFAPEALHFERRAVDLGSQWGRVYYISDFPPSVDAGWLATAANLEGVVLSVHALPTDPTQITLAMSRAISLLAGQLAQGGSALAQQRIEQQIQDAHALLRKIDQEQQTVFTVAVFALVTAPDEATGLRRCKRLESTLAAGGMRARPLAFRQEDGLKAVGPWGMLPQGLRGGAPFQLPAETLAASVPFSGAGINHGHGVVLGHDTSDGLVLVDRWNPPADAGIGNPNIAVLGPSGGGKSHTVKLLALREWAMGATVLALDPEKREYQRLCDNVGGTWLNAAGGSSRVNPFQPPPARVEAVSEDGDATPSDLTPLQIHIPRLLNFLGVLLSGLTATMQALLASAVRETYERHGIRMDVDPAAVANDAWPHIGQLFAVCREHAQAEGADPEWRTLAALLQEYAVGIYAPLWAGPSTVPPVQDAHFVVFDLMDLADAPAHVKRAQFLNVLSYAWDLVRRDKAQRKILLVDEAWLLIDQQNPETLRFLKAMAKLIRGYSGSLMVVTQNVYDFLAPAVRQDGEPVLTNASTTILMRQDARNLTALTDIFSLSEAEQIKLKSAPQGEGLLIAGNHRAWVKIDTAPHETAIMYG